MQFVPAVQCNAVNWWGVRAVVVQIYISMFIHPIVTMLYPSVAELSVSDFRIEYGYLHPEFTSNNGAKQRAPYLVENSV